MKSERNDNMQKEILPDVSRNLHTSARRKKWNKIVEYRDVYIMLIPIVLYFIIFRYAPMFGNVIAFQDYSISRGILESKFVGFKHFASFLKDVNFWRLLRNSLMINVYGLIIAFPAPIILALLLNEVRSSSFKRIVQTVTYMPHFISVVIIVGMVKDFIAPAGLINSVLGTMGIAPKEFLTDPKYFRGVYTAMNVWSGVGWGSIIYISALSGIDQELYEAAAIDGASRWKQTIHITFPGLLPTIAICLIMRIGQMLTTGFESILLLYNPSIYETADVISTYVYRRGILNNEYSFSSAVGLFNSIISLILILFANWFSKKASGSGLF